MPPLDDLLVLDFSTLLPGPLATLMLAEAGARVIKVEKPGGEDMRRFPPVIGETSAPFLALNRGKESLVVDLKNPADRARLDPWIARADVLVEQFRPGVMARLGLDYATLAARHPRLVYCSITGFGQEGPRAAEPGHDIVYQALSGLLSTTLDPQGGPPPATVADIAGGAWPAVMNILLALRERERTGRGRHLDIAMTDGAFTFGWFALAMGHATGTFPATGDDMLSGGSPRYGFYPTADGRLVAVGAIEPKFWEALCAVTGLDPTLRDDARDPAATRAGLAALFRRHDAAHWRVELARQECCCVVVATWEEARADPHFAARGLFRYGARDPVSGREIPAVPLPLDPGLRIDDVERDAPA